MPCISTAVEGAIDEAVARRIIQEAGGCAGLIYGRQGKENIRIGGFNRAAVRTPWFVLVDLNGGDCAPNLRVDWLPNPSEFMCFRIAIREVEAWLLADREQIARFLRVSITRIPRDPEALEDPKEMLVNIARQSRSRDIREGLAPSPQSGLRVGPTYTGAVTQFAATLWRPGTASGAAPSLGRCLDRVATLVENSR
jgi:hypothetical protein